VGIDHDAATPLYLQLAGILRDQIGRGELTSRVPSLKTLSQEHGVSHVTAEKALAVLKEEGIVRSVIGRGTYVVPASERGQR
jgi:GntR family transcriptional regulator